MAPPCDAPCPAMYVELPPNDMTPPPCNALASCALLVRLYLSRVMTEDALVTSSGNPRDTAFPVRASHVCQKRAQQATNTSSSYYTFCGPILHSMYCSQAIGFL